MQMAGGAADRTLGKRGARLADRIQCQPQNMRRASRDHPGRQNRAWRTAAAGDTGCRALLFRDGQKAPARGNRGI